jgi:hypothetical protein
VMEKTSAPTQRCLDRFNDSSVMRKSIFLFICAIAGASALRWRFAQICRGASLIIFPSASSIESSPRTVRSCFNEICLVPAATCFFVHPYKRNAYRLRSPIAAGFCAI